MEVQEGCFTSSICYLSGVFTGPIEKLETWMNVLKLSTESRTHDYCPALGSNIFRRKKAIEVRGD